MFEQVWNILTPFIFLALCVLVVYSPKLIRKLVKKERLQDELKELQKSLIKIGRAHV